MHGQGLVESIGEFAVTGAGVGGALSTAANVSKALARGSQAARLAKGLD